MVGLPEVRRQPLAQFLFAAVQPGAHVGLADAQNLGDLAVAPVFEVEQDERPVEIVEPVEKQVETRQALVRAGCGRRPASAAAADVSSGTARMRRRRLRGRRRWRC